MRLWFLVIFLAMMGRVHAGNDADSGFVQLNGAEKYDIIKQLHTYTESRAPISAQLAYRYFIAGKFSEVPNTHNDNINDGLVNKNSWLALQLVNQDAAEASVLFEFILSGANSIECYLINDDQMTVPLVKSSFSRNRTGGGFLALSETYTLNLKSGEKTCLLIHVINRGQLLYIPTQMFDLAYFKKYNSSRQNYFGIFEGIFLFIILFNLLIYCTTFDRIYLLYLLYACFISIFALNEVGTVAYGISIFPVLNLFSGQSYLYIGFAMWLLLMIQFLNEGKRNRLFYRVTLIFVGLNLIFAFLPSLITLTGFIPQAPYQHVYQSAGTLLFVTSLCFIIISNTIRLVKGNRLALFYALANIPVILGVILQYSNLYEITHISFGWSNPIAMGLSIETFLISFGFAYRYNLIGQEKQQLLMHVGQQQKELISQIFRTQESEKKRIAEDLHDELGGNLAAMRMTIQSIGLDGDRAKLLTMLIDKASVSAHNIAHNLMPPEFEKTSLAQLLHQYYKRLNAEGGIRFDFHCSGGGGKFIKLVELMIYRIIMELTNNIIKHSRATEATVQLVYHESHLSLIAEDNGIGFTPGQADGLGLKNINTRITYLQGTYHIDSDPHGTTVSIQIPYKEHA